MVQNQFYRRAYFNMIENTKPVIALVGPRQVGKTYALKQMMENFGGEYYDFKAMTVDESDDVLESIYRIVRENTEGNLYLDEITYLDDFEHCLAAIADAAALTLGSAKYKIFITGSQQVYIENAMNIAFGARAGVVRMDFISFTEYYDYSHGVHIEDYSMDEINRIVTEEDYMDYLFNNSSFNCMYDCADVYLKSCLDETLNSHMNAAFKNNAVRVDEITIQDIKAVTYTIIVSLIDRISTRDIADYPEILKKVRTYYNQRVQIKPEMKKIRKSDFEDAVNASVLSNYKLTNRLSKNKLLDCIRFLYQCRLVNITVYSDESKERLASFYNGIYEKWKSADDFLSEYSVTFAYPHFFVEVLKDICKNLNIEQRDVLFGALLGALVENTIKGQLAIQYGQPLFSAQKYNENGTVIAEVDYYNDYFALEMSVSNKSLQDLHFAKFNFGNRKKILTTKDSCKDMYGITCIPYYVYQIALENNKCLENPIQNINKNKKI